MELSRNAQVVYLWLADHADSEGFCYPSIQRLSGLCHASKNTVKKAIRELEEYGLVEKQLQKKDDGRNGPNLYWVIEDAYMPERNDRSESDRYGSENNIDTGHQMATNQTHYEPNPVNQRGGAQAPTLKSSQEVNREFFEGKSKLLEEIRTDIQERTGWDRSFIENEIASFKSYWTEPTPDGTQQRWEMKTGFKVRPRIYAWFNKTKSPKYKAGRGVTI
jgi:pyocin large subunit-like protein